MEAPSTTFSILSVHDALLDKLDGQAEQYFFTDLKLCPVKLRQFGEVFAQRVAVHVGIYTTEKDDQLIRLNALHDRAALSLEVASLFHELRKAGNDAVHAHKGTSVARSINAR